MPRKLLWTTSQSKGRASDHRPATLRTTTQRGSLVGTPFYSLGLNHGHLLVMVTQSSPWLRGLLGRVSQVGSLAGMVSRARVSGVCGWGLFAYMTSSSRTSHQTSHHAPVLYCQTHGGERGVLLPQLLCRLLVISVISTLFFRGTIFLSIMNRL